MTNEDEGHRRDFWQERENRSLGDDPGGVPEKDTYVLNLDRKILLQKMLETQDWMKASLEVADPYTFAYCAQAGWLERRRRFGVLEFRITDDGITALAANR